MVELVAVIMAGGGGTRFWPLSTPDRPKQFLALSGERTLLQQCRDRLHGLVPPERIMVLTGERFVPLVREQLPDIPANNIIGEAKCRDTAAAITLAAQLCRDRFGDPVMAVLPADQHIEPAEPFRRAISAAADRAGAGVLYTVGIVPTHPSSAYGYLVLGGELESGNETRHYRVARFHEKPDGLTAARYVREGALWNAGVFVWRAGTILAELEQRLPGHVSAIGAALTAPPEERRTMLSRAFEVLPAVSIDHAVMEHAEGIRCVTADFTWSDLGGWRAAAAFLPADAAGNRRHARLAARDASGCIVYCECPDETVAIIGVSDLVVARAGGRTLVVPLARADEVKQLLADAPDLMADSAAAGTGKMPAGVEESHRPWGWYRVLEDAPDHKVKRIVVYPGKRLSLQRHNRRDEHWYVVRGRAVAIRDDERIPLEPGGAVDIARGAAHRIENPGADDLAFIEVQTGEYFGEDDIERVEDDYGRA